MYQIVTLNGKGADFIWLLDWHKGHFGSVNLETIYPFFNALGLLTLVITLNSNVVWDATAQEENSPVSTKGKGLKEAIAINTIPQVNSETA